ncbi:GBF1 [Bugula neritina]|uniref:GBF1 n=1 Tax=Bugula neritina TaxID=10212 RepID=A0A7J7KCA8_BUGNE|nr:GBF1 [Bugula neritina]
MHTLHTRASSIFHSWAEEQQTDGSADEQEENICDAGTSSLWRRCWCPLLQGIARLCTDMRKDVRSQALTYLQRALLVQDLNQLTATEWEACFNKVLFPLLSNLLENSAISQVSTIEETRFRAATLLSKVYLQHLQDLLTLPTFTALWLTILDFMDKYMHADQSDQLMEGIPELLKNLLLVMGGMDIFYEGDSSSPRVETQLCRLTCDRLNTFLPALKRELFTVEQVNPVVPPVYSPVSTPAPISPQSDITESTEPPLNTSHTVDLPESASRDTGSPSPPPSSQVRRPVSPEAVHRSTSPLVHSIVPSAFTVKLHPPLAPPVSMTPPTLLPVNSPIVVPDPTLYSSSNSSATLPVEGQGLLLFNTATPPILTRSREEPE